MRELLSSIERKEWRFVSWMTLVVILITIAPFLYGFFSTPKQLFYLWIQFFNPNDFPVYYSYLEQVKQGHLLFENLFTSEDQPTFFFNIFFIFWGMLGKIFNLPAYLTFQLARIILIPIALISFYLFLSFFFKKIVERKTAFTLLVFSSGLGIFFSRIFFKKMEAAGELGWWWAPIDIGFPPANTFFTLYHNPLHISASIFLVFIFLFFLLAIEKRKMAYSIISGLLSLILLQFHPYHIPTILLVPAVFLLILFFQEKKILWYSVKFYAILVLFSLPSILYHLFLLRYDFGRHENWIQSFGLTPNPLAVIVGFGIPFLLACLGIFALRQERFRNRRLLFTVVWLIGGLFLIYAYFLGWPRRLLHGLHIPIVILATVGISFLHRAAVKIRFLRIGVPWNNLVLIIVIVLLSLSNIYVLALDFSYIYLKSPPFYISREQKNAFDWLKENIPQSAKILSSEWMGNLIPGFTGRKVFLGHFPETAKYRQKLMLISLFFQDNTFDTWKKKFLKEWGITHLFWSEEEREFGDFIPEEKDYLMPVYQTENAAIYKVRF